APRDHAKNVFRREAGAEDRLLIVFDEGAVALEFGDELRAYATEQTIVRKDQLACSRLLFGKNIHSKAGLTDRNTTTASPKQPFRRALNGASAIPALRTSSPLSARRARSYPAKAFAARIVRRGGRRDPL